MTALLPGGVSTGRRRLLASEAAARKDSPALPSFWYANNMAEQQQQQQQQQQPQQPKQQEQKNGGKRSLQHQGARGSNKRAQKKARKRERDMKNGSHEEVLGFDIRELYASLHKEDDAPEANRAAAEEEKQDLGSLPEQGSEIEVEVVELSSTGDALALQKGSKQIYVLPFAVPGDVVKVKVHRHLRDEKYTVADFVSVVRPSPLRDDARVSCKYFSTCSGCQFQMLDYGEQLRVKRRVVEKAFRNFSQLPPELVPAIGDTIGSPLQYGYRTKLTPHFDGPPGRRNRQPFDRRPPIGFMLKGRRTTLDIEDCPIGTDAVRLGMKLERERMESEYAKYTRGATILLRESTQRILKGDEAAVAEALASCDPEKAVKVETEKYIDIKTCITDNNATSTEYVDDYVFHNPAGSFFQNNNSILPVFTDYVRQHLLPSPPAAPTSSSSTKPAPPSEPATTTSPIKYLIDAYSGSGLFTITLSSLFSGSSGIDIAEGSIAFARRNAAANGLGEAQANFIAADAGELFRGAAERYDPERTVVVLDPPRKGCDAAFLAQLLRFGPRRVLYVSCNVHTQARDVGLLVRGEAEAPGECEGEGVDGAAADNAEKGPETGKKTRYEIESLRGFDFFPQTSHVEGVAVLNRVDEPVAPA